MEEPVTVKSISTEMVMMEPFTGLDQQIALVVSIFHAVSDFDLGTYLEMTVGTFGNVFCDFR